MAMNPPERSQSPASDHNAGGNGVKGLLLVLGVVLLAWLGKLFSPSAPSDEDAIREAKELGFEPRDVSTRGFLYFLAITGVFVVLVSVALIGLFAHYTKTDVSRAIAAQPFSAFRPLAPPPRIQVDPGSDLVQYRETEDKLLHSSGWIDQKNGIARIPIERAMELLLRKGLPTQNQNHNTTAPVMKAQMPPKSGRTVLSSTPQRSGDANAE